MDIQKKTVLVLGGWGLVGMAVARKLVPDNPKKIIITSLKLSEAEDAVTKLEIEFPDKGKNYIYPALGLGGESGEVLEKIKKLIRDKNGKVDKEFLVLLEKELGDMLWYLANLASEFKIKLDIIAINNLKKLADRKKRNKLRGEGDLR